MKFRFVQQKRVDYSDYKQMYSFEIGTRFLFWHIWRKGTDSWWSTKEDAEKNMNIAKIKKQGHGKKQILYVTGIEIMDGEKSITQEEFQDIMRRREEEKRKRRRLMNPDGPEDIEYANSDQDTMDMIESSARPTFI